MAQESHHEKNVLPVIKYKQYNKSAAYLSTCYEKSSEKLKGSKKFNANRGRSSR